MIGSKPGGTAHSLTPPPPALAPPQVDEHLPEAFTIIGFAFYMQPMMMPLVAEMPPGPQGTAAMRAAVHTSLYGVAMAVYGTIGAFGASLFGLQTAGNIMVNPIIVGRAAGLGLYVGMLVYLALAMTTTHYALRKSLDAALFGADAPFTWVRHVTLTVLILSASSAVALCFPGAAAEIFNLTGATAVCVVCYIIPVYIHFRVLDSERLRAAGGSVSSAGGDLAPAGSQPQAADALTEPLLVAEAGEADALSRQALHQAVVQRQTKQGEKAGAAGRCCGGALGWLHDVCVPIAVLLLGMGCSAAALYVAIRDYVHAHQL
jgi:sodium-coupled neutral amino acid transporter 11